MLFVREGVIYKVLDFTFYLKVKHSGLSNLMNAQESSLKTIWDNPDDEVWNDINTQ